MNITVLYVGSSLLGPLKDAERELNRVHNLDLRVAAYNFGTPLNDMDWRDVEHDLSEANIVFAIHLMDGENAVRVIQALERHANKHNAVIVINCMPELMRRTRMGRLNINDLANGARNRESPTKLLGSIGSWIGKQAARGRSKKSGHGQYLKLADRLPGILKFIPTAGALTDAKHYLYLFCSFLQPTPQNIRAMLLYALVHSVPDERLKQFRVPKPEQMPSVAIYPP